MHWIEQQIGEITSLNEKISAAFSQISAETMDLKPDAKTWSINECLDHIMQSNRQYYDIFDAIARGTYKDGRWIHVLILPRVLGKLVLKAISPNNERKSKTAPIFYPRQSSYGRNITPELVEENHVLVEQFKSFKDRDLDKIIIISPVTRFVTYSLRDCITLLVDHEKRHFNQALRLKETLEQAV